MALAQDAGDSTTNSPAPTIQSDKDDYAPGELVTLTGSGWQDGESVNIKVNDDAGQTWSRNVDVTADASGNISDSFNLPDWFVATYNVTASGASGTATTSFTDGNVTVRARAGNTPLAVTFPVDSIKRFNNKTCTAPSADSNDRAFTTNNNNDNYTGSRVDADNTQSVLGQAPSPVTSNGTTYTFSHWTAESPSELVVSNTGCISRGPNSGNDPAWNITANYVVANTAPTISDIADKTILEDANTGDVAFTVGDSDTPLSNLTLTGSSSNTTLVPNANITFGGTGANRTVKVTPAANEFGEATITVTVSDGSKSTTDTFKLTVTPVNDAPNFAKGANQTVAEDSGAQTVTGWATSISKGPANESTQSVSFEVTNNTNTALFSTQPSVPPDGTLTYTPAANAHGTATVSVKIKDDGGTANNGVDTSAEKTFNISVNYKFDGFRQPVDMKDTNGNWIYNSVKAGQSIPMKFSLSGFQGYNILMPSTTTPPNPKVTPLNCTNSATVDQIEQTTTANNGLTYDSSIDQYNYVWKTQSTYSGKCYRFDMQLVDGTTHSAYFKFTK